MKQANPSDIKRLHTLLTRTGMMHRKREMVAGASQGRTESSRELHEDEIQALITSLDAMVAKMPSTARRASTVLDWKRKRVIANMCNGGYVLANGRPDMDAIYAWALKQKHKKPMNKLNAHQLSELITASEGVMRHFQSIMHKSQQDG